MACSALGQEDTARYQLFLGLFGGYGLGVEDVNLIIPLPDYTEDCGTLQRGGSRGWTAGALAERPLSEWLALQLRAGLSGWRGSLRGAIPGTRPISQGSEVADVAIDHLLDFDHVALSVDLLARVKLLNRLHAQAGARFGTWLVSNQSYSQQIVSPDDALFSTGRRDTLVASGRLYPPAALMLGVEAGLAYDLPISRHATLSPEIMASLPITSQTPDVDASFTRPWRTFAVRAGAALRFGLPRAEDSVPPVIIDSPKVVQRPPTLVTAVATEPRIVSVQIDEHDSLEMLSLLNQIYFAEGSADLRPVYRRLLPDATGAFSDTTLPGTALEVYYDILNIIGYRMRSVLPGATLTVNGYRNGRESGNVARARAESIRRYLTEVWKIPAERIRLKSGTLPPNPSREGTREGFEENARVELTASDPNVLGPILRRHIIRTATPPALVFYPQALAEAGVKRWSLETLVEGKQPWRTFTGTGSPPDSIVWNWQNNEGELPTLPLHLNYRFSVTDSAGRTTTTAVTDIDVDYHSVRHKLEHRENDTTIETYSLLLFDFDSPKVSPSDRDLLELIGTIIRPKARVRLVGYTDSLGEEGHNHELAVARARDVARILRPLLPNDVAIVVDDTGGERERFPFSTPEGRSHCRTVFIDVRTPTVGDGP